MPKVWIAIDAYGEYVVSESQPESEREVVEVFMNASLHRQIKDAVKKYEKFQDLLERFYCEGEAHPGRTRRVR